MPTSSVYLAVVKLPAKSGVPKDTVENTFCFTTSDNLLANRTAIVTLLNAFYTAVPTGASAAVGAFLSDTISRAVNPSVDMYDITAHLAGGAHGSPVSTHTFGSALPAASGTNLPSEVAACLSMKHTYGSDVEFGTGTRPRARDRGRIFLGPLLQLAMANDATTRRPFVASGFRTAVTLAAADMMSSIDPGWCIWSRKAALAKSVTGGWVDDAFDTQRRRGELAGTRTTF